MKPWFKIIGLLEWSFTFLDVNENITHSKQGMTMFGAKCDDPELSDEQLEFLRVYLSERYRYVNDNAFAYHIWLMECAEEEE